MAAEVHQDVDAVGLIWAAKASSLTPTVERQCEARALNEAVTAIGLGHLGVAEELDAAAVVVLQQGLEEMAGRMLAEIRRQVAATQLPIRGGVVGVLDLGRHQRLGMRLVEAAILGEDLFRALMRMVVHAEQQVRVRQSIPRTHRQSPAEQALSLVKTAQVLCEDGKDC